MLDRQIAITAADDALANIGVSEEGGDNRGKYIKVYLEAVDLPEGYAWCAAFIKYRLQQAAHKLNKKLPDVIQKLNGWTPGWAAMARSNNIWITAQEAQENPALIKKGYIYCFYSSNRKRIYHVGIYLGPYKGKSEEDNYDFEGVEGNTNSDDVYVNADGDGVYKKKRRFNQLGLAGGFIKLY